MTVADAQTRAMDIALDLIESGSVSSGMARLVNSLADTRRRLARVDWAQFVASRVLPHRVCEVAHLDPLTYRAFEKPRGYAGDATMMDYLYGYRTAAKLQLPDVAQRIYDFTFAGPASCSVRFRRQTLAETIDHCAARAARPIDVLALASGHLREADLSGAVKSGQAAVRAIDQDEESVALVQSEYGRVGVHAVAASVRQILAGRVKLPTADLAYSAGLYDYLGEAAAARLTAMLFESLRPGGALLIANFLPNIPDVGYMEGVMDWHLIYRDDAEMRRLISTVAPGDIGDIDQFHDPFHNIAFLKVSKVGEA